MCGNSQNNSGNQGQQSREPLLTIQQVIERLDISRNTLQKLVEAGDLMPLKMGTRIIRFRAEEVREIIRFGVRSCRDRLTPEQLKSLKALDHYLPSDTLIPPSEVTRLWNISYSTVRRKAMKGEFTPVWLTENLVHYRRSEILLSMDQGHEGDPGNPLGPAA